MGNKLSSQYIPIKDLEPAKYYDLDNEFIDLQRFVASGDTQEEALDDLSRICRMYGIPEPEELNEIYHCGTIKVISSFSVKTRLNTVFFKTRNGREFAIIFYPKI